METTPVVNNPNEIVLDDAALNPVQPETEQVSPISEITQDEPQQQKEPGWIRQRVDKAVAKAIRETEQRMTAQFEQTLAPIRDSMMERQAAELVASGEFKSKEIALEYVRLKGGNVSAAQPSQGQPQRDEQGRFTQRQQQQNQSQEDPVVRAQADLLARQAEKIKNTKGVDVMGIFNGNAEVRQKVLSGEWDFYDVAEQAGRPGVPMAVRSSNGAFPEPVTIANMTDAQFQKLQENLAAGKVYNAG